MTASEVAARPASAARQRTLCGWGRVVRSRALLHGARHAGQVAEILAGQRSDGGGVIARGAGRSYGDAAQNAGGEVLDMTAMDRVLELDRERGLLTAQAGATLAGLLQALAGHDLTLPVLPGTRHVTVGGAIASDVHGKNHPRDGSLARHVHSLRLCTPGGEQLELTPDSDPELFFATLGGMGLTGTIVQATLRTERLPSNWLAADIDRARDAEATLALMADERPHRWSVAWMDLMADARALGRSVVSRVNPWPVDATGRPASGLPRGAGSGPLGRAHAFEVPRGLPIALLRPAAVRTFNELRWRAAPVRERGRPLHTAAHLFPLDALGAWNRLYGPAGLIQYQFVVPDGQERTLIDCLALIQRRRLPAYLAVLKRLGPGSGGPLSFPLAGWTLAVDLPAGAADLRPALDALDVMVAGAGGRVYLTKDVRLGPAAMRAMYPQMPRFEAVRDRVDPGRVLRSDLAKRVGLCASER
jgi:decaprenylphospho-beta-D-ribofuranose 2-oxidase